MNNIRAGYYPEPARIGRKRTFTEKEIREIISVINDQGMGQKLKSL